MKNDSYSGTNRGGMNVDCIWIVFSILCLLYYMVCVNYAGFGSAFVFIWMIAAIGFALLFGISRVTKLHIITLPIWVRVGFWSLLALGISIFVILEGFIISEMNTVPASDCEYMIVLGAQVKGTKVSKALKNRLDRAYEYAIDNLDTIIIVSGGKGKGQDVTEAYAMKQYLVEKGVADERIRMEDCSTDTSENMRYSMKYIEDKDCSVVVVTNNFHIFRAVRLAKGQGLTNVCGVPSTTNSVLIVNYMVREAVGIVKDAVMGNF